MTKTRFLILGLAAAALLLAPATARAFEVESGDSVYVAKDQTVEGNLYAAGNTITVEGTVTGDIICAGQNININGRVEGDIICAGQTLNINGQVGGSARLVGNSININAKVGRGAQAFGATINFGSDSEIGQDLLAAGATVEIRGKINGNLHGAADNLTLAGKVGKNVRFKLDERIRDDKKIKSENQKSLTITESAVVGGDIAYSAGSEGEISSGAQVAGKVTYNKPKPKKDKSWQMGIWGKTYSIFAALVIGLVLISLWRKPVINLTDKMIAKTWPTIGWGAVVMFLTPIIAVVLMITLIGFPLALLLLGAWMIAMCLSKILVGIMVGRAMLEKFWEKKKDSLIWAMILGVVIVKIIFTIPLVGWLLALVATWWGLGGIWLMFRKEA